MRYPGGSEGGEWKIDDGNKAQQVAIYPPFSTFYPQLTLRGIVSHCRVEVDLARSGENLFWLGISGQENLTG